jgi:hypothetical protein
MAPNIGKLLCNNKDAAQQRDDDTSAMMESILRKRNATTVAIVDAEEIITNKAASNDTMLEIAETIRDLAVKLQIQQERCHNSASSSQLNSSLNRSFSEVQKTIAQNSANESNQIDTLIHQHLHDALSNLKLCQEKERFVDIATPKAGNLSSADEKTPLHSNLSRTRKNKKDALRKYAPVPATLHENPYPLLSSKTSKSIATIDYQGRKEEKLANLRSKILKAKNASLQSSGFHDDKDGDGSKSQPMSTKNSRNQVSSRHSNIDSFDEFLINAYKQGCPASTEEQKDHIIPSQLEKRNIFLEDSQPLQKIRSLSTGRTAQHGIQFLNRILRREDPLNDADEPVTKKLTSSSSDSTADTVPLSRSSKGSSLSDESSLVVNHHYRPSSREDDVKIKPIDLVRSGDNKRQLIRRSSTPTPRARSSSRSKNFQEKLASANAVISTIEPTMSNASTTSAFLSPKISQRPIKYRTIRNDSEKGFEIFLSESPKVTATHGNKNGSSGAGSVSSSRYDSKVLSDRADMTQRLKHHQRSIARMQLELNTSYGGGSRSVHTDTYPKLEIRPVQKREQKPPLDSSVLTVNARSKTSGNRGSSDSSVSGNTSVSMSSSQKARATRAIIRE